MTSYQVIGQPIPNVDGVAKVTGGALYTADISMPTALWGKTLHSPYPHARILRIDTTGAKALPGVRAVLTGADVRDGMYGRAIKDIPVLALDRVRFVGERVAAVAADDEDVAQQALDLIEVEYEELPAVYDIEAAMSEEAAILHPDFADYTGGEALERPSNAYSHVTTARGDLDQGFAAAEVIVENTYTTGRVHQGYLEPQSVLVSLDGDEVSVWTCSKAPYATRDALAKAAGLPVESIVFNHTAIGGDFGGKATPANLPIAYALAKAARRPVRMVMDYDEELMAANPRHSTVLRLRTGLMRDGTLIAHHVQFFVNCGAYAGYKPGRTIGGANRAAGPYRIPNTLIEATHVYSNVVPGGHMRGPGYPQAIFALESHLDEIARQIGMDPLAFRLKNLVSEGEEAALGQTLELVRVKETLTAAAEAAGYDLPKGSAVGRGMAIGDHPPGGGQGNARLSLHPDGSVVLSTPIFDQGAGTYTTLRQVIAEELDLPPERVRIEVLDTGAVESDSGLGSSRGTRLATTVAYAAALDAKQSLYELAATRLEWPAAGTALRGDELSRGDTGETVRWRDLLTQADASVTGQANATERPGPMTSFVAQMAEVAVDRETGEVSLLKFVTAHDVGRILNPVGHQGQINGGFVQGLGFALMEDMRIEDGHVTSLSLGDYKLPNIRDLPPLQTVLLESEGGVGPYQVRGIGENSLPPVAPAIANAIADAVGVRIRDLPITAEKVHAALQAAGR